MKHFKVWNGEWWDPVDAERFEIDARGYLRFFSHGDEVAVFNHDKWIEMKSVIPEVDFSKLGEMPMYRKSIEYERE